MSLRNLKLKAHACVLLAACWLPTLAAAWDKSELIPEVHGYTKPRFTVQANTGFNPEDQNSFGMPEARLSLRDRLAFTPVTGDVEYEFEVDFAGGTPVVQNLYMGWDVWRYLGFRIGQFKAPFGYANMSSTSKQLFVDPTLSKGLTYGRERGAELHGEIGLGEWVEGREAAIRYATGVFNGEGIGIARNQNEKFIYVSRLLFEPVGEIGGDEADLHPCNGRWREDCTGERPLRLGLGGSLGRDPLISRGLSNKETGRSETRYAVEAHLKVEGLALHGEVVRGHVGRLGPAPSFKRLGYYAQVAYNPAAMHWLEPALRYEFHDFDEGENNSLRDPAQVAFQSRRLITAGLNFYAFKHNAKLQLNYVLTDLQEGTKQSPEGKPLFGDTVIAQIQVGF